MIILFQSPIIGLQSPVKSRMTGSAFSRQLSACRTSLPRNTDLVPQTGFRLANVSRITFAALSDAPGAPRISRSSR